MAVLIAHLRVLHSPAARLGIELQSRDSAFSLLSSASPSVPEILTAHGHIGCNTLPCHAQHIAAISFHMLRISSGPHARLSFFLQLLHLHKRIHPAFSGFDFVCRSLGKIIMVMVDFSGERMATLIST
jgi:hypothetical protein